MTALHPPVATVPDVHVLGRRVVATVIDALVIGGVFSVVAAIFGGIHSVGPWTWASDTPGWIDILYALCAFAYFTILEGQFGQTLGKLVLGIRVADLATGTVPGYGPAAVRTVFRLIDGLFGYLVGFVVALTSDRRQRIGDKVGHTVVVRT
jgi:uncharacterized RDD family membrane protein YckC